MQFRNISRTFLTPAGDVEVLRNVDLDIHEGEFIIVTGPSGSGKSTFLHLCALIDTPTDGDIILGDDNIAHLNESALCSIRKNRIGIVFQNFCLLPHRTVRDNILFRFRYLDTFPRDAEQRTDSVLQQIGIESIGNRTARLLSSGEQQRVSIARAVVIKPFILLADEPTGNLDSDSVQSVMKCFKDLHATGMTILMVTHNEDLLRYGTRHLVCKNHTITEGPAV